MDAEVTKNAVAFVRPDRHAMAEALGLKYGSLPPCLVDFMALNRTLTKAVKNIDKDEHLRLLSADETQLSKTSTFERHVRKLSLFTFYRETSWGIQTFVDTSIASGGDHFWGLKVRCHPSVIIEDPLILKDVCEWRGYTHNYALDMVLVEGMREMIYSRYSGPGEIIVDEGDEFTEGMIIEITGGANESLDSIRVAHGLENVFERGEFDALFLKLVEETKAAHRNLSSR